MPDTPFSVQLSYMTRTEPLTVETLAYLVRIEAEHAAHIDTLTAAVRAALESMWERHEDAAVACGYGRTAFEEDRAAVLAILRGEQSDPDAEAEAEFLKSIRP